MKMLLYVICIAQTAMILYLNSLLSERSFDPESMRIAYSAGCKIGQHYINATNFTCNQSANTFYEYLTSLIEAK